MLRIWVCAAFVALGSTAYARDFAVVPGVRLGAVRLNESASEVHRALGKPSLTRALRGGVREESWRRRLPFSYEHELRLGSPWKYNFVNVYFEKRRVVQVETNSPRFHTNDGLSVRSAWSRWTRAFHPVRETSNEHHPFINPDEGGIPAGKHLLETDDCVSGGVGWRSGGWANLAPDFDPNQTLETLAVHRVGKPMLNEPDAYVRFVFSSRDLPKDR